MIRKTFTDKQEALNYQDTQIKQGGITCMLRLGEKFRVYGITPAMLEETQRFRGKDFSKEDAQRWLSNLAYGEKNEIDNAFELKRMMECGELYNEYEATVAAARILYEISGMFKGIPDVFAFIDDPHHYDETMTAVIKDILDTYDYEGKEDN